MAKSRKRKRSPKKSGSRNRHPRPQRVGAAPPDPLEVSIPGFQHLNQDEFFDFMAAKEAASKQLLADRRKELEADPRFHIETEKTRRALVNSHALKPSIVQAFLDRFSGPEVPNFEAARQFIKGVPEGIREILTNYNSYSSEWEVYFAIRDGQFEWTPRWRFGQKFSARQVNGRLVSRHGTRGSDGPMSSFDAPDLVIWPKAQKLMNDEDIKLKFVEVTDKSGESALNDLERFAHDGDSITAVLHKAERPYLLFILGENVDQKMLQKAGSVLAAFRKECYGRGPGKTADVRNLKETIELNKKGVQVKDLVKEYQPEEATKLATLQSRFSRVRKKLR